jgi:cytochrome c6
MVRLTGLLLMLLALIGPVVVPIPAYALEGAVIEQGEQIFSSNCAACHMGGGTVIRAHRCLKIRDLNAHLVEYQQDPLEAIEHQIEAGKNAMPSYEGKLSEAEIIAVATFVEQQAELGW